ncbi:MAG TPA: P-II family nitrogen regulator [Pirellulaceae bacterium]|nr:P-II family nitrogen regulator [Pirellulaceae bacterium]
MRMVLALIQPTKLKAVQEALHRIGVERMTVCDALGYGQQLGRTVAAAADGGKATLLRKVALEIAVNEDFLDKTVETIAQIAKSGPAGAIGDGKIFVLPVEQVVRLSDTVCGPEAVS